METSTYKVTLKTGASYAEAEKLVDIKDFPDLGGEPDQIEVTTLSDSSRRYIAGIKDQQSMNFTANYEKTAFTAVNALDTETTFWLNFDDAPQSVFTWKGTAVAFVTGAGVNEGIDMTISVTPSTSVELHNA